MKMKHRARTTKRRKTISDHKERHHALRDALKCCLGATQVSARLVCPYRIVSTRQR